MEKEIFDLITDYIFSTQSLIDRINRLYTMNIKTNSIDNSLQHLVKRIDRVEEDEAFLLSSANLKLLDFKTKNNLNNYVCSVQLLIKRLENKRPYLIEQTIKAVEHYEDKLLSNLNKEINQQELNLFINSWLEIFKNVKLNNQLLNKFKQECIHRGYKQIEILTEMVKRGA